MPGYSIPVGYAAANSDSTSVLLPIGFHLMGNHWAEHVLLRLGHVLDSEFGAQRVTPKQFYVDTLHE